MSNVEDGATWVRGVHEGGKAVDLALEETLKQVATNTALALGASDFVDVAKDNDRTVNPLPSGAMPSYDPVGPIVAANVYDTGIVKVSQHNVSSFRFWADTAGLLLFLIDYDDELGNGSQTVDFSQPTAVTKAGRSVNVDWKFPQDYARVVVINTTGNIAQKWTLRWRGGDQPMQGLILSANQPIFGEFPAEWTQTAIKGQRDTDFFGEDVFDAVNVHTENDYTTLAVGQGHRISQMFGRSHVQMESVVTGAITPVTDQVYVVPAGKKFYATAIFATINNILATAGVAEVRDDTTRVIPIAIPEGTNQTTGVVELELTFPEPVVFETDVTFHVPATGVGSTSTFFAVGYLEDA